MANEVKRSDENRAGGLVAAGESPLVVVAGDVNVVRGVEVAKGRGDSGFGVGVRNRVNLSCEPGLDGVRREVDDGGWVGVERFSTSDDGHGQKKELRERRHCV